jgi:hypothetical protein
MRKTPTGLTVPHLGDALLALSIEREGGEGERDRVGRGLVARRVDDPHVGERAFVLRLV